MAARCTALREWQAARLRRTHADLLNTAATREAAQFFLDQLYGSQDFLDRDVQFARIVPVIARLFSADVRRTVMHLAELHALSETLDTAMALTLAHTAVNSVCYRQTWLAVGRRNDRERQIELVGLIGKSLMRYTRHPSLGRALRLMRLPAKAAGLNALQRFLETGFATFGALPDPQAFVDALCTAERLEAQQLFES